MKAIILARVSTEEQREAGNSLPAQIKRIEDYCKRKNFKITKIFSFDESAYKTKRDEFDKLLEAVRGVSKKTKISVCFDKVDRLSRSVFDKRVGTLYEMAIADQIELHFVSDGQVINNQMSAVEKFQFGMSLGLAKYYSDAISDNVKRVFEQKRNIGEWAGPAPFGYKNIPLNLEKRLRKNLIPDPETRDIVLELYEKYATGNYSARLLAEDLDKRGIRTKNGKKVHQSVIHLILKNTFYYGVAYSRKYNKYFDHIYEPLITKDLYDKVQTVLKSKNCHPVQVRSTNKFMFTGLLTCAKCGCCASAECKKSKYIYYACTNGKGICKREYINENELLKPINKTLEQLWVSDEDSEKLANSLREDVVQTSIFNKSKIKEIDEKYQELENMISHSYDLLARKSITHEMYDKKLKEYKEQQKTLLGEKIELSKNNEDYYLVAKHMLKLCQEAREIFKSSEVDEKREFLKFLLQNSFVNGKQPEFSTREPFNTVAEFSGCPIGLRLVNEVRTSIY